MSEKLRELGRKVQGKLTDERHRRRWQAIIGASFMFMFIVSSVFVNKTVLALNQAAGRYGYYGGTYGYKTTTSSDQIPSTPGSQTAAAGNGQVQVTWTAVRTTTGSTTLDNFSAYKVYYATSSSAVLDSSNAGTNSGSASTWTSSSDSGLSSQGSSGQTMSTTITGLTNGTTYYFAVYAIDGNGNYSSAPSSAASTAPVATSGGGGGGGGGTATSIFGGTTTTATTTTTTTTNGTTTTIVITAPPAIVSDVVALIADLASKGIIVVQNTAAESAGLAKVVSSASEFKVSLGAEVKVVATNFVAYGTSSATVALGSGERLAVVRDLLETLGTTVASDSSKLLLAAEQISNGQKPSVRNLAKEQAQAKTALVVFQKLTGHKAPDFKNAKDDLAWNTMLYRVRFARDLGKERAGIVKFRATFGKSPKTPADWAAVRAWAYALK